MVAADQASSWRAKPMVVENDDDKRTFEKTREKTL